MKAKKRILYIGLALWLIAFLQMIHTGLNPVSEEEAIVTAFADNDFLNTVSTITASGNYKNIYLADSDREDLLLDLAHKLGISETGNWFPELVSVLVLNEFLHRRIRKKEF